MATYAWKRHQLKFSYSPHFMGTCVIDTPRYKQRTYSYSEIELGPEGIRINEESSYHKIADNGDGYKAVGEYIWIREFDGRYVYDSSGSWRTYVGKVTKYVFNVDGSKWNVDVIGCRTNKNKGSYLDTVISNNKNNYPKNGALGNYWYEFSAKISGVEIKLSNVNKDINFSNVTMSGGRQKVESQIKIGGKLHTL